MTVSEEIELVEAPKCARVDLHKQPLARALLLTRRVY